MRALMHIGGTIKWTPPGEPVVIENRPFATTSMPVVFPGWAGLFTVYYPDNVVQGHRVVFVEAYNTGEIAGNRSAFSRCIKMRWRQPPRSCPRRSAGGP